MRYRLGGQGLVGRPDLVFRRARIAVFCDGDYWHGRDLEARVAKLEAGHNATYWVTKIRGNVDRDRRVTAALEADGWLVLRYWESDIHRRAGPIAREIAACVRAAMREPRSSATSDGRPAPPRPPPRSRRGAER